MKFNKLLPAVILSAIIASSAFAYQPQNPNGQATGANSSPVVIASDQTLALPTGAATSAAQTTGNSSLSTIVTNTGRIPSQGSAAGSASLPVVIASDQVLPLPTGAATASAQSTGNGSLATIVTNTGNIPAKGTATSANSTPVTIATDQAGVAVLNNIVANTSAGFARPANTTAYASGQLVANITGSGITVPSITVARANDLGGFINQVQLKKTSSTLSNALFRVHFFNVLPTVANGDGSTWSSPSAGYLGYFDVTMEQSFSDPAATGLGRVTNGSNGLAFTPVSGTQTLYYLIEARAAYAPASGETLSLKTWTN